MENKKGILLPNGSETIPVIKDPKNSPINSDEIKISAYYSDISH